MHIRLSQHLNTNYILVIEQCGFKKGISTEDAAFRLKDSVFKTVHQKMRVGRIVCDLVKVFDCANHAILLATLHFCAIRGVSVDWFRFCLTNRRQKVEVKSPHLNQNVFSDWGKMKHSPAIILRPLLFIIIDIDTFINCNWVFTRWQQYSTHLHTNNTQNDTTIWESAGRAPSWLVIPWHLPYNWGHGLRHLSDIPCMDPSTPPHIREWDVLVTYRRNFSYFYFPFLQCALRNVVPSRLFEPCNLTDQLYIYIYIYIYTYIYIHIYIYMTFTWE